MFDCLAHERRKPVIADKVVISLASAERRNTTVPKLVDAGFRVLDAIDGRLMSKEEIAERFDTALFEDTFLISEAWGDRLHAESPNRHFRLRRGGGGCRRLDRHHRG